MARFRLLTPDAQYADDGVIERRTAGADVDWDIFRERTPDRLTSETLAACDAIVLWHEMKVDRALLASLKNCRIIVRAGVGFDHIDLEAAAEIGIPICNTPDYGTSEVADHAIGLMLALKRGIVSYHQHLVADTIKGFDHSLAPLVGRLRGKVFGVVGLGRIGVATALRAKAFGMSVAAYDPLVSRGTEISVGERLLVTPHAAWSSPESVADARRLSVETAMLYLRDGKLRNLVNTPAQDALRGAA